MRGTDDILPPVKGVRAGCNMTVKDMVKGMKQGHEIVERDWNKRKDTVGGKPHINFQVARGPKSVWRWWPRGSLTHEGTAEEAAAALEKFLKGRRDDD